MLSPDSDFRLARDINTDGAKTYYNVSLDMLEKLIENDNNLYEMIASDKPCKMYFDFDGKIDDSNSECLKDEKLINKIGGSMKTFLEKNDFNIDDFPKKIKISTSTTDKKVSFHIVLIDIIPKNNDERKAFFEKYKEFIKDKPYSKYFDGNIYTSNRLMRMINQSKLSKKTPLKKYREKSKNLDHIITYVKNKEITKIPSDWIPEKKVYQKREFVNNGEIDVPYIRLLLSKNTNNIEYKDWSIVGQCLKTIFNDDDEGLDLFEEWSKSAPNYLDGSCEKFWMSNKINESYNIGTLINMANDCEHEQIQTNRLLPIPEKDDDDKKEEERMIFIELILAGLPDLECAELFYKYKKNDIYYSEIDGYHFYIDYTKLWRKNGDKNEMLTQICEFFREQFTEILEATIQYQIEQLKKAQYLCKDNNKEIKKLQTKIDNCYKDTLKKIGLCQSAKWGSGVLKHVDNLFKRNHKTEEIMEIFDNNVDLYPLGNSVLDFRTKEIRERRFEDFFTYTNDTEYIPIEKRKQKEVDDYMKQILNTNDSNYVKNVAQIMAYNLCGRNDLKKVVFLVGDGDNGKSVYTEMNNSINKSQVTAPERAFIKKTSESVLQTELVPLIKKRCSIINEPEGGAKLNESLIKTISGNDKKISIRSGGDKGYSERIISCKLVVILNQMIQLDCKTGMTNRVLVIDFCNRFERDDDVKKQILSLKNHYFSYLVDILHEMYNDKFQIQYCKQILLSTEREKDKQDSIKQFINEEIEITKDEKDKIIGTTFYELYRIFCLNNSLSIKTPIEVGFYLLKNYGYNDDKKKKTNKGIVYKYMRRKIYEQYENDDEQTIATGIPII
jgi:P4 family phage/plasmid primase-like protien